MHGGWHTVGWPARRMGDTGVVTSSAAASTAGPAPAAVSATPEQARRSWPWSALQGAVLVVLAVVAVVVADTGVRLLLAGLGVLGLVRGRAGGRQVEGARTGLVETMGGGVSGIDGNGCVVAVLAR